MSQDTPEGVMTVQVQQNTDNIDKLRQTVFGNGDKGMDEDVRNILGTVERIETSLQERDEKDKEEKDRKLSKRDKIQVGVIITLLVNMITAVFAIIQ